MAEAPEYELTLLRKEAELSLYRGRECSTRRAVLALALSSGQSSPQSLRRLEHEYSLKSELHVAWAAQPRALTRYQGRMALILEDPGGEPLDRLIGPHRGQQLDLTRFLRIGIGLTAALRQAHRQGLIHKDVNPANVLVDDSGHVWLTGFGIASTLRYERQIPAPPEIIGGTFAYMAPEQTGRMNRSMDSRSDLYSLGVTLYQMLTDALPFVAADPLEWFHCHIAQQPVAPGMRRAVPEQLSVIIMRLLAKNAEERYQTAAGLEADLRRCQSQWQSQGRIDRFPLGADDASDQLLIPEKLYGREREVAVLLAAFDRVAAQGRAELVLVSGYSGIGKSSVVNELHKALVPPRALFAAGKFDQYRRDVPYATLAQAFQMLVRQILLKSKAEVDRWRHLLLEAVGPSGQLMVNLIPEVEFVIGKQPPVAELAPREARGRFQLVFRRFLGAFARPEHPLALFLDDLQWLDSATLELLERLVTDPDMRHVLIVGAYRDNEVSAAHPLMRSLATMRVAGARTYEIALASLSFDDVNRLIAEALLCGRESAAPLAHLVNEKTGGNPFFAIQFLTSLAEERLLRFDWDAAGWIWDLDRIRAKSYSGNVADLMVQKLRRQSARTQSALQQLACLGNVAEVATLATVSGQSEEDLHTALLEAVHHGLIVRLERSYAFLHDRIHEAAYALIPEQVRAEAHLKIGRTIAARFTAERLAEHLFEVANHLNLGAGLLVDRDEKHRLAAIDLTAGRKAKASSAYMSARAYFAAGIAQLDERDWSCRYELQFALRLECAECELVCGNLEEAERLIAASLPRAATRVDAAGFYTLKVQLHVMRGENQQAVDSALVCLLAFGIDMPTRPSEEQVQTERGTLQQTLNGRSIESLVDLPLMADPELQAAMKVLSILLTAAHQTDTRLCCLLACRMVTLSVQHGTSGYSASAYTYWGSLLGTVFRSHSEAYRFSKLACEVVEKHAFVASRALAYLGLGVRAPWTQPLGISIDYQRVGIRAAIETGSPFHACVGTYTLGANLLLRNDPLDVVWQESEIALDFARTIKHPDWTDVVVSQQRFIKTMQGGTASFSTFSDAQFDEVAFEARLTPDRMTMILGWYWVLKLKARFLAGDYAEALEAIGKAKQWLETSVVSVFDYYYYAVLTVTALYDAASVDQQAAWRDLLVQHRDQLREWAESCPSTFSDKYSLILAEMARLEKRDADAIRLYEQAIHSAREHGFVQNEGLGHELAAQYYLTRGIETAGYAYLRHAQNCYERWGAFGKVKQLDARYPLLREERASAAAATLGPSARQFDVGTIVKASQALSSEVVLPNLIERLMRIAVEHAGAERGLLILVRGDEPQIEAEATTGHARIDVVVRQAQIRPFDLARSVLNYVIRTREGVLLDDASLDSVYSTDEYVRRKHSRSILCLPIVKQAKLVGALYLENDLAPLVFTPSRVTVLELLASQAAISLENADLYKDLQLQVGLLQHLPVGAYTIRPDGTAEFVNQSWLDFAGQTHEFIRSHPEAWMAVAHPEDRESVAKAFWAGINTGLGFSFESRSLRAQDGIYYRHLHQIVPLRDGDGTVLKFIGTATDIEDQKRAEEDLRQAQGDLARINRVTTMGELAASLAHELRQPISGVMTNADSSLLWLARAQPDLARAGAAITRILRDARRAADILDRIRVQFEKGAVNRDTVDFNEIMRETVTLLQGEAVRYNIALEAELAVDLPAIRGDRVQLQQVVMNLIVNGIEAMKDSEGAREMVILSRRTENEQVLVSVSDTGAGFSPELAEQLFDAFFTTKPSGTGMGLRISRSIIESHGGRLWAEGTPGRGATFYVSVPAATPTTSGGGDSPTLASPRPSLRTRSQARS